MFLNNQKYWVASYTYSNDLYSYIQSISAFLSNILIVNNEQFKIIDIANTKYESLVPAQKEDYYKNVNLDNIVPIAMQDITTLLWNQLIKQIENKLKDTVETNKDCLFQYEKKIFFIKKRKDEQRTIIQKINGGLKRGLQEKLKNEIITFFQQHINNTSMDILKVFIQHTSKEVSFIEDDNSSKKIDFLPVKLTDLSIESDITYAKNEYTTSEKQLKIINNTFNFDILESANFIIAEAIYEDLPIGLILNEYLFIYDIYPLFRNNNIIEKKIKIDYLKYSILLEDSKTHDESENIKKFKDKISDYLLLEALQLLKENLYIEEKYFEKVDCEVLADFFDLSYLIETDYLKHNQFFIPYTQKTDALFGLHNNSNARNHSGTSEKGLKTWINSKNQEQNTNTNHQKTSSKQVMHLLPDIAFYFKEKFFEDLLIGILKEIKQDHLELNLEIIDNKIFYHNQDKEIKDPLSLDASFENNSQEFDFIVNYTKADATIATVVIEAKTKLSKFIIQEQAEKVEKYIKHDNLNIFDNYFLVGFNIDENIESGMAYFQNNMKINDTEDLGFEYPLPITDQVLYCVASSNREILKKNLLTIFV